MPATPSGIFLAPPLHLSANKRLVPFGALSPPQYWWDYRRAPYLAQSLSTSVAVALNVTACDYRLFKPWDNYIRDRKIGFVIEQNRESEAVGSCAYSSGCFLCLFVSVLFKKCHQMTQSLRAWFVCAGLWVRGPVAGGRWSTCRPAVVGRPLGGHALHSHKGSLQGL